MLLINQKNMLWDSCICIDFISAFMGKGIVIPDRDQEYFEAIKEIWQSFEEGRIVIYASTLAFVESVKIDGISSPLQVLEVRKFFQRIYNNMIAIGQEIAEGANTVRSLAQISLCQYDSIHLSTAINMNIPILITRDDKKPRPFLKRDNKYKTKNGQ